MISEIERKKLNLINVNVLVLYGEHRTVINCNSREVEKFVNFSGLTTFVSAVLKAIQSGKLVGIAGNPSTGFQIVL